MPDLATDRDTDDVPAPRPSMFRPDVYKLFKEFSRAVDDESAARATIRGLLQFKNRGPRSRSTRSSPPPASSSASPPAR